ncbi:heparinase II/III family protein [Nonomuraea sp. ATR24]|uniref:heparinase II/III domain-containing protein n=1 Tax=Nonomuraea sp. ATR24 TaxID=1676744 RepID=UPI0035BF8A2D
MLAYDDGRLPAYGDGWAECFTADFAPHAEAAWSLLPERPPSPAPYYAHPRPAPVRLWYGAQLPDGVAPPLTGRSSVAALVFGPGDLPPPPPDPPRSFVWPGAGIGLLRSGRVRAALRYGPDAGWHDHRDKLGVDVATATGWSSLDLGTSGYGSGFTAWLRSPVAHNTVTIGGRPQPPHTGRLVASSPGHLTAESAFDGHTLRRALTVTGDGWTDEFTVTPAAPDAIEWTFHGDGPFTADGEPALLTGDLGHAWLRDVRRLRAHAGVLRGAWDADGAPSLELTVPDGFEAYAALADGNPNGRPLGIVLLRGHAAQARVHARFTLPPPAP